MNNTYVVNLLTILFILFIIIVKLPEELARTLQNTTAYKTMNEEEIRRY